MIDQFSNIPFGITMIVNENKRNYFLIIEPFTIKIFHSFNSKTVEYFFSLFSNLYNILSSQCKYVYNLIITNVCISAQFKTKVPFCYFDQNNISTHIQMPIINKFVVCRILFDKEKYQQFYE